VALGHPVLLFKARNRVTTDQAAVSTVIRGVALKADGFAPLGDAEAFTLVRRLLASGTRTDPGAVLDADVRERVRAAEAWLEANKELFALPFDLPVFSFESGLWPAESP